MGTLGNLIPPAIGFIVFAEITRVSVGKLFIGGIVPGLMIGVLTMVYIIIRVKMNPKLAPGFKADTQPMRQNIKDMLGIIPFVVIIFVVLGSMFSGLATPTESAAIGVFCALVLAAAKKRLSWSVIKTAGFHTIMVTSMIMLIIVFTYIMSGVYGSLDLAESLMEWCLSGVISPTATIIAMCAMYVILGCFIEGLPLKVLTLAVVYQVVCVGLGYDGVWLGALNEVIVNTGMITPPVAVTLFVTQGLDPESRTSDIFMGVLPILTIMLIVSAVMIIWPEIVLWLPNLMTY
jgi:tripartite ATP-independent transporter DctM subunit